MKTKTIIEYNSSGYGLFSQLSGALEWIYSTLHDDRLMLYINLHGAYEFDGNAFSALFKPFECFCITTSPPEGAIAMRTRNFPMHSGLSIQAFAADGIAGLPDKYVYCKRETYKNPGLSIFRNRCNPIVKKYFQPVDELQKRIDAALQQMNCDQNSYKIGIHIRCSRHFLVNNKRLIMPQDQFLDDLEKDIDEIMKSKDPKTVRIFLATLLEPVVHRICSKYKNVVVCDIERASTTEPEWDDVVKTRTFEAAEDAIVDAWCLANCDELLCGASNVCIFTGCINPNLKISLLPCLENYEVG